MRDKIVVMVSGGLDSATCLAIARSQNYEIYALSFDYGQLHHAELNAAKQMVAHSGAVAHQFFSIPIHQFGHSALTDKNIPVPDFSGSKDIPVTYVPARNTIFLSIALAYAEIIGANQIMTGVSSVDYSHYPDCRPDYIDAFQKVANLATKKTVSGGEIKIVTPLIHLSKAKTIELGMSLGVDYSGAVSCYKADHNGLACGTCDSCTLRKKGFAEANVPDPTRYQAG